MIRLIVNADDYGYFPEVSRGIREAAQFGTVTATGVLVNGASFEADVNVLSEVPELEVGVHLNLTHGRPLTEAMRRRVGGIFPDKWRLFVGLGAGALPLDLVQAEWDAQIRRCLALGLRPAFLNSHEHVHMWPALRRLAMALGVDHGIRHIRHVVPDREPSEWRATPRHLLLGAMARIGPAPRAGTPRFLGLGASGRISLDYLERAFRTLHPGETYELMCHPGHTPPDADSRLRAYHDWEGEWRTLLNPAFRALCARHDITLVRYAELV